MEISSGNTVEDLCTGLFLIVLQLLSHIVIHIVKGFSIVNEVDIFLELSSFCYDPTDIGNLISIFVCLFAINYCASFHEIK